MQDFTEWSRDRYVTHWLVNRGSGDKGNRQLKRESESPERMGDSLKRQIPTVGSRRWEDKQQRESFLGSHGREQKWKMQRNRRGSSWVFKQGREAGCRVRINMLFPVSPRLAIPSSPCCVDVSSGRRRGRWSPVVCSGGSVRGNLCRCVIMRCCLPSF